MSAKSVALTAVEGIKARSDFLRGSIVASLADTATGALAPDDTQLSKFHGFYQQDDRDVREERRRQVLEPDYQFMIRARVPGGVCTPRQWLALDAIARTWANGTLRLTTRQAFQLHGVLKRNLKASIRAINDSLLDTLAACGDVNRNVLCTAVPERSAVHRQVYALAVAVSKHLTPRTTAYHEIWLEGEGSRVNVTSRPEPPRGDAEPIYGPTYLPRKFKMGFAVPPRNDVDLFAQDLGFIAVPDRAGRDDSELAGFNVTVGGGMGATHADASTYPRLADVIGFCTPDRVIAVSEAVVTIQRDFGDRGERKHARLKYTIDDRGLDWFRTLLEQHLGFALEPARPFAFTHTGDQYGWQRTDDDRWHLTLFIENGRIEDRDAARQLTGLRAIAQVHRGEFRLTANQNVVIAGVAGRDRAGIDRLVSEHGLDSYREVSPLRLHSLACVGFPTCGLAMAESERYLPALVGRVEALLQRHDLRQQAITLRMTGCPNGCARPYLAEIGLVGKGPGLYNLHLGAAFDGTRLSRLWRESVDEQSLLDELDGLFGAYAAGRDSGEAFGDFLMRTGRIDDAPPPARPQ
jgi:sulfite reductase (NADPH) hemoprotein beta-component